MSIFSAIIVGALIGGIVGLLLALAGINIFERLAVRKARRALDRDEFWSRESHNIGER